jgi:hypothetical protein
MTDRNKISRSGSQLRDGGTAPRMISCVPTNGGEAGGSAGYGPRPATRSLALQRSDAVESSRRRQSQDLRHFFQSAVRPDGKDADRPHLAV